MAAIAPVCLLPTWWASLLSVLHRGAAGAVRTHTCVHMGLHGPCSGSPWLSPCVPRVGAAQGRLSPAAQDAEGTPAGAGTVPGAWQAWQLFS